MERIIITITERIYGYSYDLEVPTNLRIDMLLDDITQTLMGYNPQYNFNLDYVQLISRRMNRILSENKTLDEESVWNGDILELYERDHIFEFT